MAWMPMSLIVPPCWPGSKYQAGRAPGMRGCWPPNWTACTSPMIPSRIRARAARRPAESRMVSMHPTSRPPAAASPRMRPDSSRRVHRGLSAITCPAPFQGGDEAGPAQGVHVAHGHGVALDLVEEALGLVVGDLDPRTSQLPAGLLMLLAGPGHAHPRRVQGALVQAVDVGMAEPDEGDAHVVQEGLRR